MDEPPASFRQLRLFEAVGRLGSVTKAAASCGLSQPAATHSLAALQRNLGVTLINGGTRGTAMTGAGVALHEQFSLVLRKLERGFQELGTADPREVVDRLSHAHLRLLVAAAAWGSFENATAALGISRRTAQRTMRQLQELVQAPLFVRTGGGMVLTDRGMRLTEQVGLLSDEVTRIVADAQLGEERAQYTIVLGVAPDPGTAALSQVVKSFVARRPKSCVELCEAGQSDLLARLAIGEVDLVVGQVSAERGEQIEWRTLATSDYRIVARRGHPLGRKRAITVADLLGYPWLLGARGSQRRAGSDTLLAGSAQPQCSLVTSAPPLMAQLLVEGDHLCLMTDRELARRVETLAALPYRGPLLSATIGWARRKEWRPASAHLELLDLLEAQLAGREGSPAH